MKLLLLASLLVFTSCSGGPGLTPIEQDGLTVVDSAVDAPILFTMDRREKVPELLVPIFHEYSKTPLVMHVVWRTVEAPSTADLAQFSGRKIRQYWDARMRTASTGGQVRIQKNLVAIERLPLRMGLARAAAFPSPN